LCEFLADTKLQSFSLLVRSSIKRAVAPLGCC